MHHPSGHPFDELCELIRQRGWGGTESASTSIPPITPPERNRHLSAGLPGATLSDSRELVQLGAALVKSDAELAYMREAGALTTRVMNQALRNLAPGKRQKDIIADVYHAQISGLDGMYGDYTSNLPH